MEHFTRITDASRLQAGDILVIPSESSRKAKRLHVSCDTYRKMGLSIGFTGRSVNTSHAVNNLLARDNGEPRALFVCSVELPYMTERDVMMMSLGGNVIGAAPAVPVICRARIGELPFECPAENSDFARLFYANTMSKYVVSLLSGKIKDSMFFSRNCNWATSDTTPDDTVAEAFESRTGGGGSIANLVPCVNCGHDIAEGDMPPERIDTFTTQSLFDCNMYTNYRERQNLTVDAPKKFFEEFVKRGAALYRPSPAFITAVAARALSKSFAKYAENIQQVIASAALFEAQLRAGVKMCKDKISAAEKLVKELGRIGGDREIVDKFREAKLCQR